MFLENFCKLCEKNGIKPNFVCKELGLCIKKPPPSGCTALSGGFFKKTRRQETIFAQTREKRGCRTALPASLSYHMQPTKSTENRKSVTMEKSEVIA